MDLNQIKFNIENYQNQKYLIVIKKLINNILELFNITPLNERRNILSLLLNLTTPKE